MEVIGRAVELAKLAELLRSARGANGSALVLRGEAGIGKSALLEAASRQARAMGMTVLAARGTPAESRLPFGALHQALWPLLRGGAPPAAALETLRVALGRPSAATPDLYGVAYASRELLAWAAGAGPVFLAVEDGHWLDPSTARVLSFVGQRLGGLAVAMVIAVRDGHDDAFAEPGLAELAIGPLAEGAARVLLERDARDLPLLVRRRLLDAACGNPLALLELPAAARGTAETEPSLGSQLPMTARLERAFAARLPEMPDATRTALLVLAADTQCTLGEITAATGLHHADASAATLEPAIAAGLVHVDGTAVRFRHPLVASSVYRSTPVSQRIAVHTLLGALLAHDPDRSVWHRATAATAPDDALAADLVEFARRAAARGAVIASVDALERAAALTKDQRRGGDLLLEAAQFASCIPHGKDRARTLAGKVDPDILSPRGRVHRALVEELGGRSPAGLTPVRALVRHALDAWEAGDRGLAYGTLLCAALRCWMNDAPAELRSWLAETLDRLDPEWEHPSTLMLQAYLLPMERGQAILRRVARRPEDGAFEQTRHALVAQGLLGEFPGAVAGLGAIVSALRAGEQLATAARFIGLWASADIWAGEWGRSLANGREAEQLALATGDPEWRLLAVGYQAWTFALRGETERADELADQILRDPHAAPYLRSVAHRGLGMSALNAGRAAEAFDRLARLFDPGDPSHHYSMGLYAVDDLADAARACDRADQARVIIARLESSAGQPAAGEPVVVTAFGVNLRYARAVLAEGAEAGSALRAALAADLTAWPYHRARLRLAYGKWLRRQRRHAESRVPLRLALDALDGLGARSWAADARCELRAAGDPDSGSGAGPAGLSAQERRIAELAARGLSNREIGDRLVLSQRTVSAHLYRIFPKLGVTSRGQLAAALADSTLTAGAVPRAGRP